ncbi:MAG: preprotein translocase subunit SecE [Candidatus Pacebacteria bacterium]|nr:preprotein translocase subunit SecE [Candidatus Paceibacterota bacterium]
MGLVQYLKETQAELKHVSWPTQKQTTYFTIVVIVMSLLTAAFLGAFDALFSRILEFFVT